MNKYLITGASLRGRGAEAMVFETCRKIKEIDAANEISLAADKSNFDYDQSSINEAGNPFDVHVIAITDSRRFNIRYIGYIIQKLIYLYDLVVAYLNGSILKSCGYKIKYCSRTAQCLNKADIIIQVAGISFTDNFGVFYALHQAEQMLLARALGKKYFCAPQAYGPSTNLLINTFARIGLNRVTHIMPRGQISMKYLISRKIRPDKISPVPDLAFSFNNPLEEEVTAVNKKYCIDPLKRYIGVAFNSHLYRWCGPSVIQMMAHVIDYLTTNLGYDVILISHEFKAESNNSNMVDDRYINRMIYQNCINKDKILNIEDELRANEIKALLKSCQISICARFHAMISSLKMGIPPLVIGWSDKYLEVMEQFALNDLVLDYRTIDEDMLIQKIIGIQDQIDKITLKIHKTLPRLVNSSDIMKSIIISDINNKKQLCIRNMHFTCCR
ncbi:MAG: polysaccharide pyruvyl transferase family protein [Dehalococcoidales bacterium]|nr:polysaccharide pyruvyl transferase family protein [Dehalococcoidales bacterium]